MKKIQEIKDITEETAAAYFDLEFCNERISRKNVPVAIGVTYRRGGREIGTYHAKIWCGDGMELWEEQLDAIGYGKEELRSFGKPMEEVTEELLMLHETYRPMMYISFGKQDEQLLNMYTTQELSDWNFLDATQFLSARLGMKYDISLEKYAYICRIDFIHRFLPLEDARSLADIVWQVLSDRAEETRRQEVAEEYERKMFLIRYRNKQQACAYLENLSILTPGQKEKLKNHRSFLKKNERQYINYTEAPCTESAQKAIRRPSTAEDNPAGSAL